MRRPELFHRGLPRWVRALLLLVGPAAVASLGSAEVWAQERPILSREISVSGSEASLRLEFSDGGELAVNLREGAVRVDGETVGRFTPGDALDREWRALLGRAISLENGPLARELLEWRAPTGLSREGRAGGETMEGVLAARLSAPSPPSTLPGEMVGRQETQDQLLQLLSRAERLPALGEALRGVETGQIVLHVGEGYRLPAGERVDATLVLVDGDGELTGTVTGDLVVVGGSVSLQDGSLIQGDVRLAEARLFRNGGEVEGEIRTLEGWRPREEVTAVAPAGPEPPAAGAASRVQDRRGPAVLRPFRHIFAGLAGLTQTVVAFLLLAGAGWAAVHFAGDRLQVVADTAREGPLRAALVGVAGAFLVLPAWILGVIALAISIVGILALPFWVVLFPVAVAVAALFGALGVALLLGEWILEQDFQGLERFRSSNRVHAVTVGVAALLLALALANVVRMAGPLLGFFRGLLSVAGVLALLGAAAVGLGSLLLSRGGAPPDDWVWGAGESWQEELRPPWWRPPRYRRSREWEAPFAGDDAPPTPSGEEGGGDRNGSEEEDGGERPGNA